MLWNWIPPPMPSPAPTKCAAGGRLLPADLSLLPRCHANHTRNAAHRRDGHDENLCRHDEMWKINWRFCSCSFRPISRWMSCLSGDVLERTSGRHALFGRVPSSFVVYHDNPGTAEGAKCLLGFYGVFWASTDYLNLPKSIDLTTDFLYLRWTGRHGQFQHHDRELEEKNCFPLLSDSPVLPCSPPHFLRFKAYKLQLP